MANRLKEEQSVYLLQHANNPVNWYPWGDEAFAKAQAEHKAVLVSIGYSACHWCHVMERESFEDAEVAKFMNDHFVCIKVDREEYPDVDHVYMDAVSAMTGSGGWPLNVFVTPDRKPFYGGTYFPPRPAYNRPSWSQILYRMAEVWEGQKGEAMRQADQLMTHLGQAFLAGSQQGASGQLSVEKCRAIAEGMLKRADTEMGGFGGAPKFPGTMALRFLLEHYYYTGFEPALRHVIKSLDAMAGGGIYDQVGGGFARYATDRAWLVPHFEKMLYDNAQLIQLYCDAYKVTGSHRYKEVVEETLGFMEREMRDPSGGYYAALDADSEGVEGKFYTWDFESFEEASADDRETGAAFFGVTEGGNWEHTNILHVVADVTVVAETLGMETAVVSEQITRLKQNLLLARAHRVRPGTDDKCILSWNALMNVALTTASVTLAAPELMTRAKRHMEWMLSAFGDGNELKRIWKSGIARIAANTEDYACLIKALIVLGTSGEEEAYLLQAGKLTSRLMNEAYDEEAGLFYYTLKGNDNSVPLRKIEVYDGVLPSANALMAENLETLGICLDRQDWIEIADRMLTRMSGETTRFGTSFGYWASVLQQSVQGRQVVVTTGEKTAENHWELITEFSSGVSFITSKKEISDISVLEKKYCGNKTHIFVCSRYACQGPLTDIPSVKNLVWRRRNVEEKSIKVN